MSEEEINKTIAEYMDIKCIPGYDGCNGTELFIDDYTTSLDALVPVWKKMKAYPQFSQFKKEWDCEIFFRLNYCIFDATGSSIQLAAAHATAHAIKELSNKKDNK